MSKFTEIGREDCRFYRGRSCYALKVFDCRLGNKCKFYQPDLSDGSKARTYGADVRYYAKTEKLRALMKSEKVKVIDLATAMYIDHDTMSRKINAKRVIYEHEAEKICDILEIPEEEFTKYFRIEEDKK